MPGGPRRIHRMLKKGNYSASVLALQVYLAAVLAAEILELAGNAARDNKKDRIVPRHMQPAIRNDKEYLAPDTCLMFAYFPCL
ncbi:histone 2A [Laccaria bicolor S238N-H82]|uniref:Histone H2A n=1 Tax=Laccaria bicolor (strain S238N-H82 / ATCC MYA-4686) TaxID=486041 RepID=B0D892_LACBS|nr:histone 2A [Laccaria bicolor S238N-H82]EDR09039.1 histone 2A [Laccaria bicolor S238N-H82]|eukprot:XP_001880352.1 histone 2A [Laccaria bicolor S238N-H82]